MESYSLHERLLMIAAEGKHITLLH